ncbi:MAG: RsmB/NOP family class I SAM-dependent RNA methyltransferase, partial [Lachnospiraceae bacterium]|nr:RsmB/NOP family class I SAM-dependent RNA methyltransferase [Lachnospiraceae bacterium]
MNEITLPAEFCSRMQGMLTQDEYQAFLASYRRKRLFSLRVNPIKCERTRALDLLNKACAGSDADGDAEGTEEGAEPARAGYPFSAVPWEPDGFYYPEEFRPGRLPWHEAGMYYIQEASAMAPARLCGALPGERILDLCAAPGGKSTRLAADLCGQGLLVSNEIHPERARVLSANLERMGVRNALVTNASPRELASRFPLFFDRIVVDAPCSGEGMFRKEEEALRHWSPDNVRMCADRQREILEEAAVMLHGGGTLVYSTCTFAPEENEGVLARFLRDHPEYHVVDVRQMPGVDAEGWGFAPGQPVWARQTAETAAGDPATDGAEEAGGNRAGSGAGESDGDLFASLAGTVRLWPHRLEGEGHFAAVLRKEGKPRSQAIPLESGAPTGGKHEKKGKEQRGKKDKEQRGKRGKAAGRGKRRDPRETEL